MRELADEEIAAAHARLEQLDVELLAHLLPKDARDEGNIFLEIRAGTGGDEAALFAGDLFRMYARYAERQGWQVEVESASAGEHGGYKEVDRARRRPRRVFEAQVRVRRPPRAARAGDRSAGPHPHLGGTVAIIAESKREGEPIEINPADLRIDTFRASRRRRPARQQDRLGDPHHPPADRHRRRVPGRAQPARQPRQGDEAAEGDAARSADREGAKPRRRETRKLQVGSGDRSERIRTYNFPQGRVTDHRINLTLYDLPNVLDGNLDALVERLASEHQADELARLTQHA